MVKPWILFVFVLAEAYTVGQAIRLADFNGSVFSSVRGREASLLGGIAGFWIGAILCCTLARSMIQGNTTGPRRKGLIFLGLLLLTVLCLFGGAFQVLMFSFEPNVKEAYAWAGRLGGLATLLAGAVSLTAALGRTRGGRRKVRAVSVESEEVE